jgi:general secretion pathway protein D
LRQQQVPALDPSRPEVPPPAVAAPEVTPAQPSLPGTLRGDVQIVPDETTNSLLVRAETADWEVLRQTILALDLRPLQVLIEVLIAEVRHTRDLQVGVAAKATDKEGEASAELKGETTGDFIFKIVKSNENVDVTVTLSALAARGDVRILSRPVIFAQNNQEARILVGAERPFVQVFRSLPTDAAVRDQVVQYRDVGTSLTILPTINPDGYINLQLTQEVSTATAETQFGAPVISTREASTHVFMRDGQTAIIGGLIDRQGDRSRSGIPILSDIPILGYLFGTTRRNRIDSELFLFLTPRIVSTDDDIERVRGNLQGRSEMFDPRDLPSPVRPLPAAAPRRP